MASEPSKAQKIALRLLRAGVSVIPTKPTDKRPAVSSWKQFQSERADEEVLPEWFRNGNGLAIIGGAVSGNLMILDFDQPGLYDEFKKKCEDHGIDALERCAVVESPSGGNHVYLQSAEPVGANDKLAMQTFLIPDNAEIEERNGHKRVKIGVKSYPVVTETEYLKCVIETRGEGGYAVTYPTDGYRMLQGRHDSLQVLSGEEVQALLGIAQMFDTYKPPALPEPEPSPFADRTGKNTPGNDYNERGNYEQVLLDHGWQPLHRSGTKTTWIRPGKEERQISATTGHDGARMLYVFSSNAAPFDPGRKYSPFSVYGLLEHAGDFRSATHALVANGYGDPATEKFKMPRAKKRTVADQETDAADAEREQSKQFQYAAEWAELNKDRYIYLTGDQWFEYRDGYWEYSSAEDVQRSVQEYLADVTSVTSALVANVRTLAKSMVGPHRLSDFNAHSNWIPLQNGVLDTITGELLPHSPDNRVTNQAPYDYVPGADCPVWRRCLDQWLITVDGKPCREWQEGLQEWFGYCLIPDNTAQLSMMWVGDGANGKGTACRALEKLIGKQFTTSIPIEQLHDPYHRAELYGKLVGFVNEPDPRAMLKNGNHFKAIVGGDSISARRPTEKVFTFTPMTRLVISCNTLPTSKDLSRGYFRRLLMIDWRYNVPVDEKDQELDDKVQMELPGILNWALEGLARWRGRKRKFVIPEESARLLEQYRLEQDNLRRFIAERCIEGPKAYIQNSQFYGAYKCYCEEYSEKPEPTKIIAARLAKMGFVSEPKRDKETQALHRCYCGLDIKEEKES